MKYKVILFPMGLEKLVDNTNSKLYKFLKRLPIHEAIIIKKQIATINNIAFTLGNDVPDISSFFLIVFYGISTLVGYLIPNPVNIYICVCVCVCVICKQKVCL